MTVLLHAFSLVLCGVGLLHLLLGGWWKVQVLLLVPALQLTNTISVIPRPLSKKTLTN